MQPSKRKIRKGSKKMLGHATRGQSLEEIKKALIQKERPRKATSDLSKHDQDGSQIGGIMGGGKAEICRK